MPKSDKPRLSLPPLARVLAPAPPTPVLPPPLPSMVLPPLQFSGVGEPTVEEFVSALDLQIIASGVPRVEAQIASRLTGRAHLWYVHCFTPPSAHLHESVEGYRFLQERLRFTFSRRYSHLGALNMHAQGADSVIEYVAKVQAMAHRVGENIDTPYRRMWWIYGLQPDLKDLALNRTWENQTFMQLVESSLDAERRLTRRYTDPLREGAMRAVAAPARPEEGPEPAGAMRDAEAPARPEERPEPEVEK